MVASRVAELVAKGLRELGYRVAIREAADCSIVSAQAGDRVYVISLSRGRMSDVYVVKVVAPELLLTAEWSCEVLEYSPHGYYVLERDPDKLLSSVLRKLELVDRVYRSSG